MDQPPALPGPHCDMPSGPAPHPNSSPAPQSPASEHLCLTFTPLFVFSERCHGQGSFWGWGRGAEGQRGAERAAEAVSQVFLPPCPLVPGHAYLCTMAAQKGIN